MKVAYLIDRDVIGGGNEYIRRKLSLRTKDDCRVFYTSCGAGSAAELNEWGAEEIVVNHLRSLLRLYQNPFVKPRGRTIFVVHGIHLRKYDFLPPTPINRLLRFLRLHIERRLYRLCDELIALTPADRELIHQLYGRSLKVRVDPNTNDGIVLKADGALPYKPDSFAFVTIARPNFQKGLDLLFAAVEKVAEVLRAKQRRLLLVGGAKVPPEISDLIESVGCIDDAGVYMTCGKVLIAPSRWEGMPYLLLEAKLRKRTIVASDCPGNREALDGYHDVSFYPTLDIRALADILCA